MTEQAASLSELTDQWVKRVSATVVMLAVALVAYGLTLSSAHQLYFPIGGPPYRLLAHAVPPVRLVVPSLKISAAVVPIQLASDASLEPPADYRTVGWWDGSAETGARTGQTVITGHTVHTGGGAMDNLPKLKRGAAVDVVTTRGTMHYRVERVVVLSKDDVAKDAVKLFGQRGGNGRLVLITCTNWNGSFYPDNVVVFGKPLGVPVKTNSTHVTQADGVTARSAR